MKIKIVTDSGCDISQELAKEKGIRILPLKTLLGGEEFLDGVTINTTEFYEKLIETDEFPKTSQVAPYEYEEAFREELETADHILCLAISSKISGCYQSALIAAEEFPGKVSVVDSKSVSLGARNFVEYAISLVNSGMELEEIVKDLNEKREKLIVVALLDTLEYLKRGGRISAAAALAGSVLSIKPVIGLKDGEIVVLGKARGSKNANNLLTQCVAEYGPVDYSKPYCLAYSGLSDAMLRKYLEDNSPLYEIDKNAIDIQIIGSTVGAHSGPGAVAASFFVK